MFESKRRTVATATAIASLAASLALTGCGPEQAATGAASSATSAASASDIASATSSATASVADDAQDRAVLSNAWQAFAASPKQTMSLSVATTADAIYEFTALVNSMSNDSIDGDAIFWLQEFLLHGSATISAQKSATPAAATLGSDFAITIVQSKVASKTTPKAHLMYLNRELYARVDTGMLFGPFADFVDRLEVLAKTYPIAGDLLDGTWVGLRQAMVAQLLAGQTTTNAQPVAARSPGTPLAALQQVLAAVSALAQHTVVKAGAATSAGTPIDLTVNVREALSAVQGAGASAGSTGALGLPADTVSWLDPDATLPVRCWVKSGVLQRIELDLRDVAGLIDSSDSRLGLAAQGILMADSASAKVTITLSQAATITRPTRGYYFSQKEFAAFAKALRGTSGK